jgi:Zn-dependent peptidase ImmA (M78 family)/transcriptional regulator with XRE-family HTH domain
MSFEQALFKGGLANADLLARARESSRLFVRSLDQLAEDNPQARGRRLSAYEALRAYGREALLETLSEGSALLSASRSAAGRVLRERRELLNLTPKQVAAQARVELRVLEAAERSERVPIIVYERIARTLGLDERYISARGEPVGNERLAVRLRTIGDEHPLMTPSTVAAISEAAWVASTQIRLEEDLGIRPAGVGIDPSPNYGQPGYPAFLHGYFLASDARQKLGLGDGPLPHSLRQICEDRLGIPVVQAELGEHFAGVTVQVGARRAIVLSLGGANRHVYVRRSTVAHELGHLLYDVEERLNELRVDDYRELEKPAEQVHDFVEQRANAFAVEFLAPRKAVVECKEKAEHDPVGAIMDAFGVSFTIARYQLWNALDRRPPLESLGAATRHRPLPEFEAEEAYTADYHPIRGLPTSRAGRFSAVVLRAATESVVSWQTAAEYLQCEERDVKAAGEALRELFPAVFSS